MMRSERSIRQHVWFHLAAPGVASIFAAPVFWMIITSLHSFGAPPPVTREWLPVSFEWSNYLRLFDLLPLEHYPLNSRS
ncbi:MAG: hypothetical protein C0183_06090 [Roseiflexus castenholzii]|uniref:hypothetical protein n=1 Tax=Roseiflexus castenholzii TaxID=120962 RepID=UPI000CBD2A81|nr:MAG: hypothetical protein C0183_06090 [Roseiflexus castenholzii]